MTNEEKIMAYDEALKRAREIKNKILSTHLSTESCKAVSEYIDTIIPELAESEDERIRKKIINIIKAGPFDEEKDVLLDWLEKQKENIEKEYVFRPLAGTDIIIAAEQAIRRANEGDKLVLAFNGAYIPVKKGYSANKIVAIYDAFIEKQKENSKSTDSIPSDCISDVKYEDRWHKVKDSLPNSAREVLCRDAIGNFFIGRYYKSTQSWEVEMYDDCNKSIEDNPPVVEWCEIPSEKQKEQKPIKMEVYEVGKGTTICGQDYKCKKDFKEGNCWYIKDIIYHCSRDGYLTDQNGVSWSCTPEWFKEYIYTNSEWADKEKNDFVSGQFLQCKLSFDEFKEGEHYWLEYIGDDMYVGRSDNILNQKFHITPRQLYTLFSQKLEEVQGPPQEEKQVSLNYEPPFNENPSDNEIIEALIKHLKEQDGFLTAINCVSTKAILDWLEKQKEQKPEGKPIKWTELTWKDIVELEGIINNVHYEFRNGIGQESFGKEVLEKFREYKGDEYLDEIEHKSVAHENDFMSKECKATINGEPIPTENQSVDIPLAKWSDEDKEKLERVDDLLWMLYDYLRDDCSIYEERATRLQEEIKNVLCPFLKSIRPSWKPSKEQMNALLYAMSFVSPATKESVLLSELYENIKKWNQ